MTIINGERAKLPSSLCNNEISSIFNEDQLAAGEIQQGKYSGTGMVIEISRMKRKTQRGSGEAIEID